MQYKGWVPTVSGNLSFSSFGESVYPTKSILFRNGNSIQSCQRRDLLDVLIPLASSSKAASYFRELIANRVIGVSGDFLFVCQGMIADEGEAIVGEVFIISVHECGKSSKMIVRLLKQISCAEEPDLNDTAEISKISLSSSFVSAQFKLKRDGELDLTLNLASSDRFSQMLQSEIDQIEHELSDQIFFFVKDLAHRHQHHDPDHDAITRSCRYDKSASADWVRNTQDALFRSVVRYKRFRSEKSLFRASGILAYAKSFRQIHGSKYEALPVYNEDELALSLQIAREEMQHFDNKRLSRGESTRNLFFALFAAVISAVTIAQSSPGYSVSPHNVFFLITETVAERPFEALGATWVISILFNYWTHRSDPAQFEWIRDWVALLQGLRLRYFVICNLTLTAAFAWLFYWFLVQYLVAK